MTNMIAIQTSVGGELFVTENPAYIFGGFSYRYSQIEDALLFSSVAAAVQWVERTSFYNGQRSRGSYSGSPRLVRVEVRTTPTYKVVGLVE